MVLKNGSILTLTIPILDSTIVITVDDLAELEHGVLRLSKENDTLKRLQKVVINGMIQVLPKLKKLHSQFKW
ncbi:hypothetical protein L1987_45877 [Smallanthus sonchifolius]|uniref:Uncharacterized protein n=1 Tax=Smallanthus sonchifolius TaxID=185202 RepID=A0ACB9FXY6_9ASTR|nr:hypothetical protein L1987_45877 [Smallanthus sonchifolius]